MQIPQGYKQTEIGVIPEDWKVRKIEDFTSVVTGATPSTLIKEYWGGDIPWMASGELNYKIVDNVQGRITDAGYKSASTHMIPSYCVLIGLAGQGKTRGTAAYNTIPLCTNQSIASILPQKTFVSKYLYYYLDSQYDYLRLLSSGDGGRGGLNLKLIYNLQVPFPPINEQERIANALTEIDELIAGLGEQIKKKRQIKEGVMQQLLTGKTRLPGFDDEWKNVSICEILTIGNGRDYKHLQGGDVPVYGTGGIITYVNEWLYDGDTVCIGRKGTIDKPMFSQGKIWTVDTLFYTYDYIDSYPKFIYYLFETIDWLSYNEATGVPSLSKANIGKIEVCIPHYNEQVAIANILTTMDDEIYTLEAERDKYTLVKQGMMQQLLTGKIRLI